MKFVNYLKNPNLLFVLIFLLISLSFNYVKIFPLEPHSIHAWRQSDCLSITLNYYQHGMNFLEPEIHNLISDGNTSGKTIGEFPVLYYFIALLWKLFGVHVWIYRVVGFLIMFWGLYSLFKITQTYLKDNFWAIWLPMLLFSSPIFADYGISFITNVTALSFVFVAFRYIQLHFENNKIGTLLLATLFFVLAGLLKTSSMISFIFLFTVFFAERIPWFNRRRIFIFKKGFEILPMLFVFILLFAWYHYAESFNNIHKGRYTFNNLWPIWEMSKDQVKEYWHTIHTLTIYMVYNLYTWIVLLIMFLVILFTPKKSIPFFYFGTIILFIGSVTYYLFWFHAMNLHDYYYIDLLFFMMFVVFSFLVSLKNNYEKIFKSVILKAAFASLLLFNVYYTHAMLELRYFPKPEKSYSVIPSHELVTLLKWVGSNRIETIQALEDIKPYLKQIGIKQEDKVISIPDQSFNITLYLMNQPGWTEYGHDKEHLMSFAKGAQYLIINDTTIMKEDYLKPYITHKVGAFRNVVVYSLQ